MFVEARMLLVAASMTINPKHVWVGAIVVTALVGGCKKDDAADSKPSASAATVTSAAPAAPAVAGACPAGETKIGEAICAKLPSGMTPGSIGDNTDMNDKPLKTVTISGSGNSAAVNWSTESFDDRVKDALESFEARKKGGSAGDQGTIPGGGTWYRRLDPGVPTAYQQFLIKTPTGYISCVVGGSKTQPDAINVCKSLHAVGTPATAAYELPAMPASPAAAPASPPTPAKKK